LIQACVFCFLVPDVRTDHLFIPAHGRDEVPARPELLSDKVSFALAVHPGQVDRTLALDKPNYLRHRVFGGNRNHHVEVIGQQMTFFDPAFLLLCQSPEHFSKVFSQSAVQRLASTLGDEHYMVFALP
jgi:hypothetical protein